jgi:hypothetical protein
MVNPKIYPKIINGKVTIMTIPYPTITSKLKTSLLNIGCFMFTQWILNYIELRFN